jgi:hypothetical protein
MKSSQVLLGEAKKEGGFMNKPSLSFAKDPFYIVVTLSIIVLVSTMLLFGPWSSFYGKPASHMETASELAQTSSRDEAKALLSGPADTEELFEMIVCPCCGSPISKGCCGAAIQRQEYVSGLVDGGASKKEVLLMASKKYGLDSIIDENVQQEIKEELARNAPVDRQIIAVEPLLSDLGDVSVAAGETSTSFTVRNDGKSDLIITGMESSCGCTTVTLVLDGVESPRFGMPGHGSEMPKGWSAVLAPGKTAELKVYYDPTVHPELRGSVTRTVTVFSDDPVNFGEKVRIEANQVD